MSIEGSDQEIACRAANGDRKALAGCAWFNTTSARQGVSEFERVAVAEVFARLAAAHGETEDSLLLAAILRLRGYHFIELSDFIRAFELVSESEAICAALSSVPDCDAAKYLVGILITAADDGDERASVQLDKLFEKMSRSTATALRGEVRQVMADLMPPLTPRHDDVPAATSHGEPVK